MLTQAEKGLAFGELHKRAGTFIIPNPWDVGSARLLTYLGFEALATSSAGYAFSIGKADNAVGRDAMLAHAASVAATTDLPVSIDLENGFGDTPEFVAETIRLAAATGAVGGSIEDATERSDDPTMNAHLRLSAFELRLKWLSIFLFLSSRFADDAEMFRNINSLFATDERR